MQSSSPKSQGLTKVSKPPSSSCYWFSQRWDKSIQIGSLNPKSKEQVRLPFVKVFVKCLYRDFLSFPFICFSHLLPFVYGTHNSMRVVGAVKGTSSLDKQYTGLFGSSYFLPLQKLGTIDFLSHASTQRSFQKSVLTL